MRKPELFGPIGIAAVLAAFVALPKLATRTHQPREIDLQATGRSRQPLRGT
jgi:hypothetical protein